MAHMEKLVEAGFPFVDLHKNEMMAADDPGTVPISTVTKFTEVPLLLEDVPLSTFVWVGRALFN